MNGPIKVLVYPQDNNPYQSLLYGSMENVEIAYARREPRQVGKVLFPLVVLRHRLAGFRIVHIHWPEFSLPRKLPFHIWLSTAWFYVCVAWIKFVGCRLVWTVHNVVPHESHTLDDVAAARYLAARADAKIVHSPHTIAEMEKRGLDVNDTVVIPHGNYEGMYPDQITREEARARLGLQKDAFVALFFGNIRTYKGLDDLVQAFAEVDDVEARLLVVGRVTEPHALDGVRAAEDPRILLHTGWIDDAEVAMFFRASDVLCAPFRSVTTSGSVLLALTFGKPLLAPRLGTLRDLPGDVGWLYEPDEPGSLSAALRAALDVRERDVRAAAAARYAKTLGWPEISRHTRAVYADLVSIGKPRLR